MGITNSGNSNNNNINTNNMKKATIKDLKKKPEFVVRFVLFMERRGMARKQEKGNRIVARSERVIAMA